MEELSGVVKQIMYLSDNSGYGVIKVSAKEYKESLSSSIYGIEKYLGDGVIEGIGPKFTEKIVEKFKKTG